MAQNALGVDVEGAPRVPCPIVRAQRDDDFQRLTSGNPGGGRVWERRKSKILSMFSTWRQRSVAGALLRYRSACAHAVGARPPGKEAAELGRCDFRHDAELRVRLSFGGHGLLDERQLRRRQPAKTYLDGTPPTKRASCPPSSWGGVLVSLGLTSALAVLWVETRRR